jgi:hypothetical protein
MCAHARHPSPRTTPCYPSSARATDDKLYGMTDGVFLSEALAWLIGLMAVGATVLCFGALFSLGRSGYRKD